MKTNSLRALSLCVMAALVSAPACVSGGAASDSQVCADAAAHVEACIPGYQARVATSCDGAAQAHAEDVLGASCDSLLTMVLEGKADSVPALAGLKTRREGNRTFFLIPLALTKGADRAMVMDGMIGRFRQEMAKVNAELAARGVDVSGVISGPLADEYASKYAATIESTLGTSTGLASAMNTELGKALQAPPSLATLDRYLIPQAFITYISTKFTVNVGVSAGVSATAMVVIQPYLAVAVDHTAANPVIVDKRTEYDVSVLGVPNVDIGVGVGGGLPLRLGIGAVFGPMNNANDLIAWAIGLSASATIPVLGGVNGKFLAMLRNPTLFLVMLGYSSGTAAELEAHGNVQRILSLGEFLKWIETSVAGQG